jgi:hypothetical protein
VFRVCDVLQLSRARLIANLHWTQLPQQHFPHVRAINAHLPADVLEILQGNPLSLSLSARFSNTKCCGFTFPIIASD